MKKSFVKLGLTEALPLPIYLIYAGLIDQHIPQVWKGPYFTSSITALLTTTFLILNKVTLNRPLIGINVYLIIGSFITID